MATGHAKEFVTVLVPLLEPVLAVEVMAQATMLVPLLVPALAVEVLAQTLGLLALTLLLLRVLVRALGSEEPALALRMVLE